MSSATNPYCFEPSELVEQPFPHFEAGPILDSFVADALFRWLACEARWEFRRETFYTQQQVNLQTATLPPDCATVLAPEWLTILRDRVARSFGRELSPQVRVAAHRLLPGFEIGIHNDDPGPGMETHRLVLQLSPEPGAIRGGDLLLYEDPWVDTPARSFSPSFNRGIGMAFSDRSFHAVTPVESGERYTVIYSFWTPEAAEGREEPASVDRESLAIFLRILTDLGAREIDHSGTQLYDHLLATWRILDRWGCDRPLSLAGLFHSVYGTESLRDFLVKPEERSLLAELIGEHAEHLVHLYGTVLRRSLFEAAISGNNRCRLQSGEEINLSQDLISDLLVLDLANLVELAMREPEVGHLTAWQVAGFRAIGERLPLLGREWIDGHLSGAVAGETVGY